MNFATTVESVADPWHSMQQRDGVSFAVLWFTCGRKDEWYGILEFNVPLDTV